MSGAPHAPSSGRDSVLVIDDDPQTLELMERYLTLEGYRSVSVTTGSEGLRQARALQPAAIILDVLMPGMDGLEVLKQLKSDATLASIPVILLSITDERRKGFALGASDYLLKPIDRARVAGVLRKVGVSKNSGTALIVEDDEDNRALLTRLLKKEGWSVTEAANGKVALDCLSKTVPTLILLDLVMPVMDGFAFLQELQKDPGHRSIPIVAITARDLSTDDRTRLARSVGKILRKGSYSQDELLREVRRRRMAPSTQ